MWPRRRASRRYITTEPALGELEHRTCRRDPPCDLETTDTHAQAHAGPHSSFRKGTGQKEVVGHIYFRCLPPRRRGTSIVQRVPNIISAKWVYVLRFDWRPTDLDSEGC